MNRLAAIFAFALACAVAPAVVLPAVASADAPSSCPGADLVPSASNVVRVESATVCLLNAERASRGLPKLHRDPKLRAAALAHSRDMVQRHYFAHEDPSGDGPDDRIGHAGYMPKQGPWVIGEDLAWGPAALPTPRQIVRAWMASAPHRRNILFADFEDIGIGVALGTPSAAVPGATYSAEFGAKGARLSRARAARRARTHKRARDRRHKGHASERGCKATASPAVSFCPA